MFNYVPRYSDLDNFDYDDVCEPIYGPFPENVQNDMDKWDLAIQEHNEKNAIVDEGPPF